MGLSDGRALANQVDHHITPKALPVINSQLAHAHYCLDVIAVDVEDGRFKGFCHVRTIAGRPRLTWRRGESDLVVDDDMHLHRIGHMSRALSLP